jgi:large subunit ribosomal protein L24
MSLKIRKGDVVEVISGSARFQAQDKKRGRVIKVIPGKNKVLVEEINKVYKHMRPSAMNPKGGRIEKESPLPLSNVMLVCSSCSKTTRIKSRKDDSGEKARYCMHCDQKIEYKKV